MSEIELHRKLLSDKVRNDAFYAALKKLIKPGATTVADIGAGTGFLSFLARKLGARHCTLIEYSEMMQVAEQLADSNRIKSLSFIKGYSPELRRPLQVDLVISETLGNFALEEGMLETLVDAWRFVGKGGTVMPASLKQFVAPVVTSRLQDEIDIWKDVGFKLDLSAAREVSLNNMYVKTLRAEDLGGSADHAQQWDAIDFRPSSQKPSSVRRSTLQWRGQDLGARLFGYALWWEVELVAGVSLSTSPFAPPTHWEQIYLPLLQPLTLQEADTVELKLTSDTRAESRLRVTWHTRHVRGGRALQTQQQDITNGRI